MSEGVAARFAGRIGGFALDVAFDAGIDVTALVGRSGAGKSSVLRCLAGLEHVPGRLEVDGIVWQDARTFLPPHRRRVGLMRQGANLLPHLSVCANLDYAARRAAAPVDLDAIVDRLGIRALLARAPGTLSGGEGQRAGLARALAGAPRLLLLDEPLSALDGGARAALVADLAIVLPALAIPVILVSHDPGEIAALASRRVELDAGRVVAPA